ncbi:MAG: ABC transporter ATP-binding protein [Candidatus Obscuribacterales bacterium]|nr:ABC transporter ATP-binding protein [Candidatus Obscuribacterales bacterium]
MTAPLLKVRNLSFAYAAGSQAKATTVIENISLTLEAGEILCVLGPSGCGKSTLLSLIAGLLQPDAGSIVFATTGDKHSRIGYIFQQDTLLPWRTVKSNLLLAADLGKGSSDNTNMKEYLKTFHLDESILNSYPCELSGGMRQRVGIIQALMFNPEILLLDEPFSALDFFTKLQLESEFHNLARQHKKGTIMVTHDIDEAIAMGDRVIIMDAQGRITATMEIDFEDESVTPQTARGAASFSSYYNSIWSHLRSAIAT